MCVAHDIMTHVTSFLIIDCRQCVLYCTCSFFRYTNIESYVIITDFLIELLIKYHFKTSI